MQKNRQTTVPSREELFGFYYLGFNPDGDYKFPNANHVAGYYRVGPEAVMRWLEEYGLHPSKVLRQQVELSRLQVDLQLEAGNLSLLGLQERIAEILAEVDGAAPGRKPWEEDDGPI